MTQIDPEVKTTPSTPTLDSNPEGAPTVAQNENISNAKATAEAVTLEEDLTSGAAADAAVEQTLETSADVKAATSKDATHIGELDPEVANAGVTPVGDHLDAVQTAKDVGDSGIAEATMVGELYPPDHVQGDHVVLNDTTAKPASTISDFNAFNSGKFAKGNGEALNVAVKNKWKILKFARIPGLQKILGGRKITEPANNVTQFPTPQVQEKVA